MSDTLSMTFEMRQLLAEASVVGEARAMEWDSGGNKSKYHAKPGGMIPIGAGASLYDMFLRGFQGCKTERDQDKAVKEARSMIEVARRNPGPVKGLREVGSLPWKREIAHEAKGAQTREQVGQVAKKYSVSAATVYRYRAQYGETRAA